MAERAGGWVDRKHPLRPGAAAQPRAFGHQSNCPTSPSGPGGPEQLLNVMEGTGHPVSAGLRASACAGTSWWWLSEPEDYTTRPDHHAAGRSRLRPPRSAPTIQLEWQTKSPFIGGGQLEADVPAVILGDPGPVHPCAAAPVPGHQPEFPAFRRVVRHCRRRTVAGQAPAQGGPCAGEDAAVARHDRRPERGRWTCGQASWRLNPARRGARGKFLTPQPAHRHGPAAQYETKRAQILRRGLDFARLVCRLPDGRPRM
ncbi:hypothetical protein J2S32_000002 [Qipengyuania citrea]|nr:hypothetical protein [Qipengyuania citrea]